MLFSQISDSLPIQSESHVTQPHVFFAPSETPRYLGVIRDHGSFIISLSASYKWTTLRNNLVQRHHLNQIKWRASGAIAQNRKDHAISAEPVKRCATSQIPQGHVRFVSERDVSAHLQVNPIRNRKIILPSTRAPDCFRISLPIRILFNHCHHTHSKMPR